jgi:hypothetical protein
VWWRIAARDSSVSGFAISGIGNTFSRNVAVDRPEGLGFGDAVGFSTDALAVGNKFKDKVAANCTIGFDVQGAGQQLTNNAAPNSGFGFSIGGAGGHTVQGNVALGMSQVGVADGFRVQFRVRPACSDRA